MRRFYVILILAVGFIFSAFMSEEDYCPADVEIQKNGLITCGTCHAIDNTVIIIDEDGKTEDPVLERNISIFSIDISQIEGAVQIATDGGKIDLKDQNKLVSGRENALFETIQLETNTLGKKEDFLEFIYHHPENFVQPQEITIQGVVADMDGTPEGDIAFSKTITIFPPKIDFSISPSIASTSITLEELTENASISIINIIGKTVLQTNLSATKSIDVSHLEKGTYFLVAGHGRNTQTQQFVVNK